MTAQALEDDKLQQAADAVQRSAKRARNATRDLTRDVARLRDELAKRGIGLVMDDDNDHGAGDGAKE